MNDKKMVPKWYMGPKGNTLRVYLSITVVVQSAQVQGNLKSWFVLKAKLASSKTVFDVNDCEARLAMTSETTTRRVAT